MYRLSLLKLKNQKRTNVGDGDKKNKTEDEKQKGKIMAIQDEANDDSNRKNGKAMIMGAARKNTKNFTKERRRKINYIELYDRDPVIAKKVIPAVTSMKTLFRQYCIEA
jgi:hypothetical protein